MKVQRGGVGEMNVSVRDTRGTSGFKDPETILRGLGPANQPNQSYAGGLWFLSGEVDSIVEFITF